MLLQLRAAHAALFADGGYEPLTVTGEKAGQALGFVRSDGNSQIAVLVAPYPGLREADPDWKDSAAALPEAVENAGLVIEAVPEDMALKIVVTGGAGFIGCFARPCGRHVGVRDVSGFHGCMIMQVRE